MALCTVQLHPQQNFCCPRKQRQKSDSGFTLRRAGTHTLTVHASSRGSEPYIGCIEKRPAASRCNESFEILDEIWIQIVMVLGSRVGLCSEDLPASVFTSNAHLYMRCILLLYSLYARVCVCVTCSHVYEQVSVYIYIYICMYINKCINKQTNK